MAEGNYHLTGDDEAGWTVKREGASRASAHFDSHDEALRSVREMAGRQSVRVILHGEGGKIVGSEAPDAPEDKPSIPNRIAKRVTSIFQRGRA